MMNGLLDHLILGEIFNQIMGFAKGMTFLSLGGGYGHYSGRCYRNWKYFIDIGKGTD